MNAISKNKFEAEWREAHESTFYEEQRTLRKHALKRGLMREYVQLIKCVSACSSDLVPQIEVMRGFHMMPFPVAMRKIQGNPIVQVAWALRKGKDTATGSVDMMLTLDNLRSCLSTGSGPVPTGGTDFYEYVLFSGGIEEKHIGRYMGQLILSSLASQWGGGVEDLYNSIIDRRSWPNVFGEPTLVAVCCIGDLDKGKTTVFRMPVAYEVNETHLERAFNKPFRKELASRPTSDGQGEGV